MSQAGLVVFVFISFVAQGYFFHDGVFRLIPYVSSRIRSLPSPVNKGRTRKVVAIIASWIVALLVVSCLLPGFLQVTVVGVFKVTADDLAMVVYTGPAWLIGFFARASLRRHRL